MLMEKVVFFSYLKMHKSGLDINAFVGRCELSALKEFSSLERFVNSLTVFGH
jgi:hypothetical protein